MLVGEVIVLAARPVLLSDMGELTTVPPSRSLRMTYRSRAFRVLRLISDTRRVMCCAALSEIPIDFKSVIVKSSKTDSLVTPAFWSCGRIFSSPSDCRKDANRCHSTFSVATVHNFNISAKSAGALLSSPFHYYCLPFHVAQIQIVFTTNTINYLTLGLC